MSRFKRLIHEIHRRSLWQVLLIYVGAAWACFELIDAVTERFGFPEWLPALAVAFEAAGGRSDTKSPRAALCRSAGVRVTASDSHGEQQWVAKDPFVLLGS